MYLDVSVWVAIVLAGVLGCVATGVAAQMAAGIPMKAVAGDPGKQLWSVIFAVPLPFLLSIGSATVGAIISYLVLMLAPTLASKFHFGPKQVPFQRLAVFNSVYAVVAIVVFIVVRHLV